MKKSWLLISIILMISYYADCQINFSGKVIDESDKESLTGAQIILNQGNFAVTTDEHGQFIFRKLTPGTYSLSINFMGYEKYTGNINLTKDLFQEFKLKKTSYLTDGVIISATRILEKSPATVKNISKREIEVLNTGKDLPMILETTPSAVTTSDAGTGVGYTGIRIRGTDMTRINVTVNGIPFNDPESHEVYWVDIPDIASSIDNIQIQRGVGTSTNGAASFGASINIQTLVPSQNPYAEISSGFGSYNTLKNTIMFGTGKIKDHWSVDGRISKITSDGYIDRATSDLNSGFLSLTYSSKKSLLRFNLFQGYERTYQAWDGIPGEILDTNRHFNVNGMYTEENGQIKYYKNEYDDYRQNHYQLMFSNQLAAHLMLSTALHFTHGEGYYEQYKQGELGIDYGLSGAHDSTDITRLISRKWLDNDFYGITYSLTYQTKKTDIVLGGALNRYDGSHFGKVIWTDQAYATPTFDHEWYRNKGIKKDFNIFLKTRYQLQQKLSAYADIQYRKIDYSIDGINDALNNLSQDHHFDFFNPKAGLYYEISANQNLQFAFAIANREPNRTNFEDADAGYSPKSEKLYNWELSYNIKNQWFAGNICAYYMYYRDQLVLTGKINNVGAPIMTNVDKSYREGIELSTNINITKQLKWDFNFTVSRNKIIDFTEYLDDWDHGGQVQNKLGTTDLSFSPGTIGSSNLTYIPVDHLSLQFNTKYVGEQYIDNTSNDSRKLPAYWVNNLRMAYSFTLPTIKEVSIFFHINNIFSEKYETNAWVYSYINNGKTNKMDGFFPQAPIHFMSGISIKI